MRDGGNLGSAGGSKGRGEGVREGVREEGMSEGRRELKFHSFSTDISLSYEWS